LVKRVLLLIAGIAAGLYFIFMIAYFATSEPSFCSSCHLVKPYVYSWRKSPHRNIKCLYCHEPRGFLGKLHSKSRGLNYVYQWATDQYSVINNPIVFQQNCIACHLGDYPGHSDAPKLNNSKTNHYEILIKKISCLKCHSKTGHETSTL